MKLKKNATTFNLGDTSFRRKTLIDDYKTLLPFLQKINLEYPKWNNEAQTEFYKKLLAETDLFSRNNEEDFAKRGRTLTNALVKIGLTNSERELSKIANNWLNNDILTPDSVENTLGIDANNLLFTRQLLKLRVYSPDGSKYFYPFRVALELVNRYQNIPQQDFLTLIHLIQPTFNNQQIKVIIDDYKNVSLANIKFSDFLDKHFPDSRSNLTADDLFSKLPLDKDKFSLLFINRKSSATQEAYFTFVTALLNFKVNKTMKNLTTLLTASSDKKIKKAFGFGKSVFQKAANIQDFLEINANNLLLAEDNSLIYSQFILSKKNDLVGEYCDMTKRTFNLSGLFDFSNGLVNSTNKDIFSTIFTNMIFSGEGKYSEYEQNLNCFFYQEATITTILDLNEAKVLQSIKKMLGVSDYSQIRSVIAIQKENKFRQFIYKEFPREKILQLLPLFSVRDDDKIKEAVSKSATVPTIYEYIVAIAWFYISKEEFFITQSLNLTLDGNMRPLSHATGGMGDIVINYKELTLMLEVTLMNSQAQKRGEWEPVLRHATNLTVDKSPKNVITLFIADEFDDNTVNIWRAVANVPLKSSNKDEIADLVKIFPLKNKELIDMLQNDHTEKKLLNAIDESYSKLAGNFNLGWRNEILDHIQ